MAYATRAKLEELWGEAFLETILPEDVDADAAVAAALLEASNEIDAYISARYTLPLATAPAVLSGPCANIAVYILANRHVALTETMAERYKQAIKLLEAIAAGKAGLGADEPRVVSGDPDTSIGGASFTADDRLFTRSSKR